MTCAADYGDPRLPDRFWDKVFPTPGTGCWLWSAAATPQEYGAFSWLGKPVGAHRLANDVLNEDPGPGHVDHLCRETLCVNPAHLERVTPSVNILRGVLAAVNRARSTLITHCPQGHEYDEANSAYRPNGHRYCRACRAAYKKRIRG
jgi:hypothetical protein